MSFHYNKIFVNKDGPFLKCHFCNAESYLEFLFDCLTVIGYSNASGMTRRTIIWLEAQSLIFTSVLSIDLEPREYIFSFKIGSRYGSGSLNVSDEDFTSTTRTSVSFPITVLPIPTYVFFLHWIVLRNRFLLASHLQLHGPWHLKWVQHAQAKPRCLSDHNIMVCN